MKFNGEHLAFGTGFVVESNVGPVLITNRHNVTGRDNNTGAVLSRSAAIPNEISIRHHSVEKLGSWTETTEPLLRGDLALWAEHPVLGSRADFIALRLTNIEGVKLFPISTSPELDPLAIRPAEVVSVIG
jgi:hypothetical protein